MNSKISHITGLFLLMLILTACGNAKEKEGQYSPLESNLPEKVEAELNAQGAENQIVEKEEVIVEDPTPRPEPSIPPLEPTDVQSLPFFQEGALPTTADTSVLEAQSAQSPEECEKYEGKLQELCYLNLGASPNSNVNGDE